MVADRDEAHAAIDRGDVRVAGAPATNASRLVSPDEAVAVRAERSRYVGRGGEKLAAALERFGLDLTGARVLDAGSSTGGFTDCALQAGATSVLAVDVGRGQLHQRLLTDPRVEVHERTNVRHVRPGDLGAAPDVVVADLSFISLRAVAEALLALARPGADFVWLVKPQFEATHDEVSEARGVIRDPAVWRRVLSEVGGTLEGRGAAIMGLVSSPIRGA
ncbi:MAG TPA: TlyA family RNA methyltransferase, partial [Aquihabitans sp.]|nr:TlyA family RNA methyltransferase [Aquihabitans sp.]